MNQLRTNEGYNVLMYFEEVEEEMISDMTLCGARHRQMKQKYTK